MKKLDRLLLYARMPIYFIGYMLVGYVGLPEYYQWVVWFFMVGVVQLMTDVVVYRVVKVGKKLHLQVYVFWLLVVSVAGVCGELLDGLGLGNYRRSDKLGLMGETWLTGFWLLLVICGMIYLVATFRKK